MTVLPFPTRTSYFFLGFMLSCSRWMVPYAAARVRRRQRLGSDMVASAEGSRRRRASALRFGVIADVQYADAPDGANFAGTQIRHYRGALVALRKAVSFWNVANVSLVVNLGDTIDGRCRTKDGTSEQCMETVLAEFAGFRGDRVVHLVGNHELYNFQDRGELHRRLGTKEKGLEYFSMVFGDVKAIVLDPYQVAIMSDDACRRQEALDILKEHNPNDVLNAVDWTKGLSPAKRHFVPYNGALGAEQLAWLREELAKASRASQKVVLLSHLPFSPHACDGTTTSWDRDEVLSLIAEFSCVKLVLAGHDHKGGYHCCERGVHHVTFKSPLNLGEKGRCFGIVEVEGDEARIISPAMEDLVTQCVVEAGGGAVSREPEGPARVTLPLRSGDDCRCPSL